MVSPHASRAPRGIEGMGGIDVKRRIEGMLVAILALFFRCVDAVGHACRYASLSRLIRQARWKAKLAALGESTNIYPSVIIHGPAQVRIGARCAIAEFAHIWGGGGVTIGNDVLIASHVVITSLTHNKHAARFRDSTLRAPVVIGDNVWIGAGAIILSGITLGSGSIIGAGSVVTCDVPAGAMVMGVPARQRARKVTEVSGVADQD